MKQELFSKGQNNRNCIDSPEKQGLTHFYKMESLTKDVFNAAFILAFHQDKFPICRTLSLNF